MSEPNRHLRRSHLRTPAWRAMSAGGELRIAAALHVHANGRGIAWPNQQTIAEIAELSRRQTQNALKAMKGKRIISIVAFGKGAGRRTYYGLRWIRQAEIKALESAPLSSDEKALESAPLSDDGKAHSRARKGALLRQKGRTPASKRAHESAPEQVEQVEPPGSAALFGAEAHANGPAKADPIAFTFATTDGPVAMKRREVWALRDEFHNIHVDTDLAGLADWLQDNPDRQKPAAGLRRWLKARLRDKAQEAAQRGRTDPAYYKGWAHTSLPTDPTGEEVQALLDEDD